MAVSGAFKLRFEFEIYVRDRGPKDYLCVTFAASESLQRKHRLPWHNMPPLAAHTRGTTENVIESADTQIQCRRG